MPQVQSYSLAGHSEEHVPGLVDDMLEQLFAQESGSPPLYFGASCPTFGKDILSLL